MWGEFAQTCNVSCRRGLANLGFADKGSELVWVCRSSPLLTFVGLPVPGGWRNQQLLSKIRVSVAWLKGRASSGQSVLMGRKSSPSGDVASSQGSVESVLKVHPLV